MKLRSLKLVPLLITAGVLALICLLAAFSRSVPGFDIFQRLELMTYDWRVRLAAQAPAETATNLGFVYIRDESIEALLDGSLDYKARLYWPRHVYGRLVRELAAQGAEGVAFDVLFAELWPDPPTSLPGESSESSDEFFGRQLREAGNVILAADKGILPPEAFRARAWAIGDIGAKADSDGLLRRVKPFEDYYVWHPLIKQAARVWDADLREAKIGEKGILIPTVGGGQNVILLKEGEQFDQVVLYRQLTGQEPPVNAVTLQRAFERVRIWDMGITMAALALKLDLANAEIDPEARRITLRGSDGIERVIPTDASGQIYIDWSVTPYDPRLTREPIEFLLMRERDRRLGRTESLTNRWAGKLAFVGSVATGSDLTDLGPTPLEKQTYLTSRFWNVANSVLTGRFVQRLPLKWELALIAAFGAVSTILTWRLRSLFAAGAVVLSGAAYVWTAVDLYVNERYWVPMVFPLSGLVFTQFALVTYRAFVEQNERRRVKSVFAKIVSPSVVNELLDAKHLSLGGTRRRMTVFFADVRGFTEMTDEEHARAEDYVQTRGLAGKEAEAYVDQQSREILSTVNLYLGTIADLVKKHDGTLDKYIGDCVMAFWGAPSPTEKHAIASINAAIESLRAIDALNRERSAENKRREEENAHRAQRGEAPLPPLKVLAVGVGVNTGMMTVGLMGSRDHILNYTVFGREVNLASRLESLAGRDRILIGEGTYLDIGRDEPLLASLCRELDPALIRGFRTPVKIFEVNWQTGLPESSLEGVEVPAKEAPAA